MFLNNSTPKMECSACRGLKLEIIRAYVVHLRKKLDIKVSCERKPEPSCITFGEYYNLFWFNIVSAEEGASRDDYWGWGELNNNEVLDGVYKFVLRELEHEE